MSPTLLLRRLLALVLLIASFWAWTQHSDVIRLIVNQRPVLFGRYSQGHFGTLLLLTPILWTLAAVFWSKQPFLRTLGNALIGVTTTLLAILVVTYVAHFFHRDANYVETQINDEAAQSLQLAGAVRHRPPNERYDLTFTDAPEQARSYPDAPPGYGDVKITLTSDSNGFRNPGAKPAPAPQYNVIAIGDSFVAGSHVSDEQSWSELLGASVQQPVYNLGVSGSGPITYLNNFAHFGLPLKPEVAIFMLYEGNDFKENVAQLGPASVPTLRERISAHFDFAMDASPVTQGLRRASRDLFEKLGAQRPVPGYTESVGFMPIKITASEQTRHYSFAPKRLLYLNYSREEFATSQEWHFTVDVLDRIAKLSRESDIRPVFIYAPSTPHVVLPLVQEQIPAQQLRNFAAYKSKRLPPADEFKRQVFANLDNEEVVFLELCKTRGWDCHSLTPALQTATAQGQQTYFSYDQHWTPEGNQIVAREIATFLRVHQIVSDLSSPSP